jgi:hypothetical protein
MAPVPTAVLLHSCAMQTKAAASEIFIFVEEAYIPGVAYRFVYSQLKSLLNYVPHHSENT